MRSRVKARMIPIFIAIALAIILVPGIGFVQGATPGVPGEGPPVETPGAPEQGPPGPQGPEGPLGPQGLEGIQGPLGQKGTGNRGPQGAQGEPGGVRQIVVGVYEVDGGDGRMYVTWNVDIGDTVFILGACFDSGDEVWITYCDTNELWEDETVTANGCGSFIITETEVPADLDEWVDETVSVRAWIDDGDGVFEDDEDELAACWPLYIEGENL